MLCMYPKLCLKQTSFLITFVHPPLLNADRTIFFMGAFTDDTWVDLGHRVPFGETHTNIQTKLE